MQEWHGRRAKTKTMLHQEPQKDGYSERDAGRAMQQWHMGARPETAATKQEGIHHDLHENHWAGDCKANSWIFCCIMKNQELDIVEELAPSKTEEPTHSFGVRRVGNVGARPLRVVLPRRLGKRRKTQDDGDTPDLLVP
jgi:hypothetical protein